MRNQKDADEAKANEEADKKIKEKLKINAADSMIFTTEKQAEGIRR